MTKTEALALAKEYTNRLGSRISAGLEANARVGVVGGIFNYNIEATKDASDTVVKLEKEGWTVVLDDVAKTLTCS